MATDACSAAKRLRLNDDLHWYAYAILRDEHAKEPPLVRVYFSRLENKRQISSVMQELSKLLPMEQMNLQHLKRVRQQDIILCRLSDINEQTINQYLESVGISKEIIELLCKNLSQHDVIAQPTVLRWQYELAQHRWPCKFHPDKYMEALQSGDIFSETERAFHTKVMFLLSTISNELEASKPCGLCIDPRTNAVIALAASSTTINPIMHCAMVLVDFVARTQVGGAWQKEFEHEFQFASDDDKFNKVNSIINGVPRRYLEFMQADKRFKDMEIGAEPIRPKSKVIAEHVTQANVDNLEKYGPYLCTGYDLYFTQEPCLMCGMSLIHSRARRIYFEKRSTNGALVSRLKLHALKKLNHHYEVFECTKSDPRCEKSS
ncbi:probable inactive tRNA-specific adenosine deaminase-like protein 3 [Eurosta solidaginis]|uniref:probable inactive tRNA-specific adenosine deaminase-like protein 3 n=1 Tax=Eurosta solidaginis TaxID=178769 RepID=UPI003530B73D